MKGRCNIIQMQQLLIQVLNIYQIVIYLCITVTHAFVRHFSGSPEVWQGALERPEAS